MFHHQAASGRRRFVALLDGSPDWVSELVREAHGDMLPDDWRYASIESALDWIADANDPEDEQYEWADENVDVYHRGRLAWLASDASRPSYCDDATSEMGDYAPNGILDRIGLGQHQESCEVFASVLRSLTIVPRRSSETGSHLRHTFLR